MPGLYQHQYPGYDTVQELWKMVLMTEGALVKGIEYLSILIHIIVHETTIISK